jgi:hypothetical protein
MTRLALLLWLAARDPLGQDFQRDLTQKARANCGREFRMALGASDPVALIRAFTNGEEGKELYVQFLKDRHGYVIARVNEIYSTDVSSFTELLTHGFGQTNPKSKQVQDDDTAFLVESKGRWLSAAASSCRTPVTVSVESGDLVFRPAR